MPGSFKNILLSAKNKLNQIVFIDQAVEDYQKLVAGVIPNTKIILLEKDRDGVAQITEILANHRDIRSIHIVSHGSPGCLYLGKQILSLDTIEKYISEIESWGEALVEQGEILLYGCNVAKSSDRLLWRLQELTKAKIAASSDFTGNTAFGGNWDLNVTTGKIAAPLVFNSVTREAYAGVLATFTVTNTDDSGAGSLREAIDLANADALEDTIVFEISGTGPHVIQLQTALDNITETVTINGYSQDGATQNDLAVGNNANIQIVLDGSQIPDDGMGNAFSGLVIDDADNCVVQGLAIINFNDANFNAPADRTFSGNAIEIINGDNNIIRGNYLGVGVDGVTDQGNGNSGIFIFDGDNNEIGGTDLGDRNIISGNDIFGIYLFGGANSASGNSIQGNYIGTDKNGTTAVGNGLDGIRIQDSSNTNPIGGTATNAGNLISGNGTNGIFLDNGANNSVILGNFIGTDATGTADLGNGEDGIRIEDSHENTVGNGDESGRNIISGNGFTGVSVVYRDGGNADDNIVQGNYIGTDVTGTVALGNDREGIFIGRFNTNTATGSANDNIIGGVNAGEGNLISGNGSQNNQSGILIAGSNNGSAANNTVQGNLIGTDVNGTTAIPNVGFGLILLNANSNTVGGTAAGAENIISGNNSVGVGIFNGLGAAINNTVQGNSIGTDINGDALGNNGDGVQTDGSDNTIGGTGTDEGNTIANNTGKGVVVFGGTGNEISSNSIYDNGDLAIDLAGDGITENDPDDSDTGANNLQNAPVLILKDGTTVTGVLNSLPNTQFRIELFANAIEDPLGSGEGEQFIQAQTVTTDANGIAEFEYETDINPLPAGLPVLTATATNLNTNDTSEFSGAPIEVSIDSVTVSESDDELVFTVSLDDPTPQPVTLNFLTSDDTATSGDDYVAGSGTFTINAGTSTATITIDINDDSITEPTETFTIQLSTQNGTDLATGTGTGTILDDDDPPNLSINDVTINEADGEAVFTVTLDTASTEEITVEFTTNDGTAISPDDYTSDTGTVTFAA
ncbi:MAG: DUF4347 domain-containing protein, partial [Oscillatoria sp. PMC 1076.18]|nr:DUF4347 domain-containing protein [Oscillatoria sp. PMC 1076.18]